MVKAEIRDKVQIFIWDHNKERVLENVEVMIDEATDDMIDGVSFHWYSGDHFDALDLVHNRFPNKVMMASECCPLHPPVTGKLFGFTLENSKLNIHKASTVDYMDSVAYAHDMIENINHGMQRWIDWNICVNKNGGPRHVSMGFGAPVIVLDNGNYVKTPIYTTIGHIAKYIKPGAVRIATTKCEDKIDVTAAKNSDGTIVCVLQNSGRSDRNYAIRMEGQLIRIKVPARSIETVII